jgi:hypothetical protein
LRSAARAATVEVRVEDPSAPVPAPTVTPRWRRRPRLLGAAAVVVAVCAGVALWPAGDSTRKVVSGPVDRPATTASTSTTTLSTVPPSTAMSTPAPTTAPPVAVTAPPKVVEPVPATTTTSAPVPPPDRPLVLARAGLACDGSSGWWLVSPAGALPLGPGLLDSGCGFAGFQTSQARLLPSGELAVAQAAYTDVVVVCGQSSEAGPAPGCSNTPETPRARYQAGIAGSVDDSAQVIALDSTGSPALRGFGSSDPLAFTWITAAGRTWAGAPSVVNNPALALVSPSGTRAVVAGRLYSEDPYTLDVRDLADPCQDCATSLEISIDHSPAGGKWLDDRTLVLPPASGVWSEGWEEIDVTTGRRTGHALPAEVTGAVPAGTPLSLADGPGPGVVWFAHVDEPGRVAAWQMAPDGSVRPLLLPRIPTDERVYQLLWVA